ncbi:c-type cytochrome [Afifella sp. IM 167]|uniref:c-type cytochrome n=1 Tax=Afifella sp. IM 167 TaxID=2033586 RepID=UPI001CCCBFCB|nr:c-type cytochrome [Afifella sp. IM 167]MBZ8134328.1 hypothetical protein [Afifella sp. IM 167]
MRSKSQHRPLLLAAAMLAISAAAVAVGPGSARAADPATPSGGWQLAQADAASPPAKPASHPGKRVFQRKTCLACHGKDGAGAILDYPNVAGQEETYIKDQITDIISGKRLGSPDATGNPRAVGMQGSLVTPEGESRLSKEEIAAVAEWLAGLPPADLKLADPPVPAERIADGKRLYDKTGCRTCHGVEGKKPLRGYPFIAGQKRAYLVAQMHDIRDGARTNGKSRTMLPFAKRLSDEDIELIADYLSQVDRKG